MSEISRMRVGYSVDTLIAMLRLLRDKHGEACSVFVGRDGDTLDVREGDTHDSPNHRYSIGALFHAGEWIRFAEED